MIETGQRVAGKVAIVTGGAVGIGQADAMLLAHHGATVIVTDIDAASGQATADKLGEAAMFIQHDVGDEGHWQNVIETAMSRFGRLDILVNNAGVILPGNPETASLDEFRLMERVCLESVFLGCKFAIPAMRSSGGGSIINMSSAAAINPSPMTAIYAAVKGGIHAYTKAVAIHCAQQGNNIRCNSVSPSGIATPMVDGMRDALAKIAPDAPPTVHGAAPQSLGEPDDVAYAVLYLASDESKYINGSNIVIDNTETITRGYVQPKK